MKTQARKTYTDWVNQYLSDRRQWGYQLEVEGHQLKAFARYIDERDYCGPLTIELALNWSTLNKEASPLGCARRLEIVRCFAKYLTGYIPETQIPPKNLLGPAHRRITPYIFNEDEITALMNGALKLAPIGGLRPRTWHTFIGLLASTGLRPAEAIKLSRTDVNFKTSVLTIKDTKFHQSRLVPLDLSVTETLRDYSKYRDAKLPEQNNDEFFLLDNGSAINRAKALYMFQCLRKELLLRPYNSARLPRLYDIRHTFVCYRIQAWYREGVDVNAKLPLLSTYIGHRKITDTYWYITGIPSLMAIAAQRFELFSEGGQTDD